MHKKQVSTDIEVLDDTFELSLAELCQSCSVHADTIIAMVEEGLLEPKGQSPSDWHFTGPALHRVTIAVRLQRDLHINLAGATLALELLEEIEHLHEQLQLLDASRI